jgi:hypothetical protein
MPKAKSEGMGSRGLMINKPFYIQSQLWMGRVMYHHPNNHVYLHTLNPSEKRQLWYYDEVSKTIKSFYEKSDRNNDKRSLDFRSTHITV